MKHRRRKAITARSATALEAAQPTSRKPEGFWPIARNVVLALVASWVVFILLLLIPMAVPDRPVIARYEAGTSIARSSVVALPTGGLADSFMECLELLMNSGENRFLATALSQYPRFRIEQKTPCVLYRDLALTGGLSRAIEQSTSYFRYWHGTNVLMRPMFAYVGADALRALSGGLVIFAGSFFLAGVGRALSWWAAAALLAPPLLMSDLAWLAFSVPHALAYAAVLALAALVAAVGASHRHSRWLLPAVVVAGATANFVDILNVAPVAWALTVFAAAAALVSQAGRGSITKSAAALGSLVAAVLWAVGFALTWLVRWLLAVPFVGAQEVWDDVSGAILIRGGVSSGRWADGWTVTLAWWDRIPLGGVRPALVVLAAVVLVFVARLVIAGPGRRGELLGRALILGWAAALVPLWFVLLGRHAADHGWFMYRGWAYALGIVAAAAFVPLVSAQAGSLAKKLRDTPR